MHALSTEHFSQASTFLFVPAHRPERFDKALQSGADAVILDLEDAVPLADKAAARQTMVQAWAAWAGAQRARVLVRMNPVQGPEAAADVQSLAAMDGLSALMLPKAESSQALRQVLSQVWPAGAPQRGLIPLIESAQGVQALSEIANAPHVLRLALGHLDLQADLGMACGADEAELNALRWQLVLTSRLAHLPAPIDGVSTSVQDMALVRADTERSRRFGFSAKLCIHPAQIAPVREAFRPSAEQQAWAQRVLVAQAEAKGGAFSVDGKMVDPPVLRLAEQLLARA